MKKLFMVLCMVIIFFEIVGCPSENDQVISTTSSTVSKSLEDTNNTASIGDDNTVSIGGSEGNISPVPEPATMFLLGSGLLSLAVIGLKRFKK
jgi:hypothetical protein